MASILYGPDGTQYKTYSEKRYPYGRKLELADGRVFRFVRAGTTALIAGNLQQRAVPDAAFDELVVDVARAIGAALFSFTNGATAIALDDFAEGYVNVEDDAGEGRVYKLADTEPAIAASVAGTFDLAPGVTIREAWTTATTIGITRNRFSQALIKAATIVSSPLGVAVSDIPASEYGWIQTRGLCSVLTDGTLLVGQLVVPSNGTAGAIEAADGVITEAAPPTGHGLLIPVGTCEELAATTEFSLIHLIME